MRKIKFITLVFLLFFLKGLAQKNGVMITYSKANFIDSPGLELSYFFKPNFGIEFGLSTYFIDYNPDQLVNIAHNNYDNYLFPFYDLNLGICHSLLTKNSFRFYTSFGLKYYYSPHFKPLHYFESSDYYIYHDSSQRRPDFGIDVGFFGNIKNYLLGVKFDTARLQFRWCLGWVF